MMYKAKKRQIFSIILISVLFLAGCGVTSQPATGEGDSALEATGKPIDWMQHMFVQGPKTEDGTQWYLTGYCDDWIEKPEKEYDNSYLTSYAGFAGDFCASTQYVVFQEEDKVDCWYELDYFDSDTMKSTHIELNAKEWDMPNADIGNIDILAQKQIGFTCSLYHEQALTEYAAVLFDVEEGLTKKVDLLPVMSQNGADLSADELWKYGACFDSDKNCYIIAGNRVLVVSEEGELVCTMVPEGAGDATLRYISKTPEGLPVFVLMDMSGKTNSYFVYNKDEKDMQLLGKTYYQTLFSAGMDAYGCLYYLSHDGHLICWDTVSGGLQRIFSCSDNAVCNNTSGAVISCTGTGDVVIMDPHTQLNNIYVLSDTAPEKEAAISLVNVYWAANMAKTAAAIYSREHPGVTISYEDHGEDMEEYRERFLLDVAAGNGPDMFIVSLEDMQLLYEKGVLADLSEVFPAELKEQVFGGIWQAGTIDGKLIGLPDQIVQESVLVSKEVWEKDTWTLDDILMLMEEKKDTVKGIYPLSEYRPGAILYYLLCDIDSSLVDLEQGISYFDSEKFKKVLMLCKNAGTIEGGTSYENRHEVAKAVENGEFLGTRDYIVSFNEFSQFMALYGEKYHWVGFPTEGESGGFCHCGGFLVVNKNTAYMEDIKSFLQLLYSEELQRTSFQCLRKDVLRENTFIPEWETKAQFYMGEGMYIMLDCKPDGTSYVEEYIEFMDNGVPKPVKDDEIRSIVMEEAAAYFAGDKDIDTVVDIIQSRVQLYLDESR